LILSVTVVTVPAPDGELGADRLMQAGAFAVEERVRDGGLIELRAVLADSETAASERLGDLPPHWSVRTETVDDTPSDAWRQHASPVRIASDLVVRPAWLDASGEEGITEVAIEPGATFGLGDHPTTRLCAHAIWRMRPLSGTVLDVGSGSGVLAVIAVLAGARSATAIDLADVSPAVVAANARRNGVAGQVTASTTALDQIDATFELVVANILAPELVAMAQDLVRVTAPGGSLVLSGLLDKRYDHVVAALTPMQVTAVETLEGWAAVTLTHAPEVPGSA